MISNKAKKTKASANTFADRNNSRRAATIGLILLAMVIAAVLSRFVLMDWPNFKPLAAIAIFAGFICNRWWVGAASLATILLVSDAIIGFYELPIMLAVYSSYFLAGGFGLAIKRKFSTSRTYAFKIGSVSLAAVAASVVFFLTTNTAVWLAGWYPQNLGGLLASWAAGIPFFKFTLASDLLFSLFLFSTYFAVEASFGLARYGQHRKAHSAIEAR